MYIALDDNGNRVAAVDASRENTYHCPVCGNPVILRSGLLNIDHFAHLANECEDRWNYDMSEWHIKMQEFFPVENREVVIKHNGVTHRADILVGKTVIEMQHSTISAEEFCERNEFFKSLGYRVAWVFDVRDKKDAGNIQYLDDDTTTKFKWNHPMRIFDVLDSPLTDYDKSFAIYLHLFQYDEDEITDIYRVVWTRGHNEDAVDFLRFSVSEEPITIESLENINEFFIPLKEKREKVAIERISELKKEAKEKGFKYEIKYIGEKGRPRSAYICPKTNKFGIELSGESACRYCKYCALELETEHDKKRKWAFYCCYPFVYREPDKDAHPGYECLGVKGYIVY